MFQICCYNYKDSKTFKSLIYHPSIHVKRYSTDFRKYLNWFFIDFKIFKLELMSDKEKIKLTSFSHGAG